MEGLFRRVVNQSMRFLREIWIIRDKLDPFIAAARIENQQRMIDRNVRKTHDMDDGRISGPNLLLQALTLASLLQTRKGKEHPPVSPIHIRLPRAPAIGPQQVRMRRAKF